MSIPEKIRAWVEKNEPKKYWDVVEQELLDAFTGNRQKPLTHYHKQVWKIISK